MLTISAKMEQKCDVLILGAGAAGLMCAIQTGSRGLKTFVLDHSKKLGGKILISGGGKCNFTNLEVGSKNFVSENPHFCKSALSRFTPRDFINMVEHHKIAFHEKKLGQLFCDKTARSIVEMLQKECHEARVEIKLEAQIESLKYFPEEIYRFHLDSTQGKVCAKSLVVATGGLSIPQMGATPLGYRIAEQFGLRVTKLLPALDGFVFAEPEVAAFAKLAGLSVDCTIQCGVSSFRENILFTHKGISGPAALQTSLYWTQGTEIVIDLFPEFDLASWLKNKKTDGSKERLQKCLSEILPQRFTEFFFDFYKVKDVSLQEYSEKSLDQISQQLKAWRLIPLNTVGYSKAEVTRGGVDTNELSSKTMESKKVAGLFFIGEVVDVTGWLGGYNFQWAWSSGYAAGLAV
jgi:predicted Rossmann fold flavoprotein